MRLDKLYERRVRPWIFRRYPDPEKAHEAALRALKLAGNFPLRHILRAITGVRGHEYTLCSISFPSRIGVAAGFDKNAEAVLGLQAIGAGFAEIGTVVPKPQGGNPKPRLFRLEEDEAIINRFGFNSDGQDMVAWRLARVLKSRRIPIGGNVGKNKDTPIDNAADDYCASMAAVYPSVDYIVGNGSSPNTPGLRSLQSKERLIHLGQAMRRTQQCLAERYGMKPMFFKISPDLIEEELEDICDVVPRFFQGLIVNNTTIKRPCTLRSPHRDEVGGLSGHYNSEDTLHNIALCRRRLPDFPIIGVGGFFTGEDARRAFEAGANLIQLHTALVYKGPGIIREMNRYLSRIGYKYRR